MNPRPDPLARLTAAIRSDQDLALGQLEPSRADFAAWHRAGRRWRTREWLGLAGWAVAGAAAAAALLIWWQSRALSYEMQALEEVRIADVPAWQAPSRDGSLKFSDGSTVELRQGSRARLDSVQSTGAMFLLDQGQLRVSIVHRAGSSWRFKAGLFEVRVTGTRFSLALDDKTGSLTVKMEEGAVRVSGCALGEFRLAAGQSATLSCDGARPRVDSAAQLPATESSAEPIKLDQAEESASAKVPPAETALSSPPAESVESIASPSIADAGSASASWQALASQGRFREAYMAADLAGFDAQCDSASSRELLELADASQSSGRGDRASHALLALRRRFPGSGASATAAFKLGRMAADQRGAWGEARQWLETCLAEAPSGVLAREASGRLMEMDRAQGNAAAARARAVQYLERFPQGPHADLARTLVAR